VRDAVAVDPVCGMTVRATPGAPHSFCSAACRQRFDREPGRFAGRGPGREAARARELGRLLRRLARQLALPVDGEAGAGLAGAEETVLVEVGERGRVTMSELALACGPALSTMTGLVDRLERRGYLRRVRGAADRRVVHVELTPRGERAHRARLEADMRIVITLLDALPVRQRAAVARALGRVTAALDQPEPSPAGAPARRVRA
jgi:DNA-binding MarR family transcriptional regulator/YHS domain-containing protein